MLKNMRGFTLIELLIVVAILGILSAIAIPQYREYITNSRRVNAVDNLRAIYLKQQEYLTNNNTYYGTATCGDDAASINTALFSGQNIIADSYYTYCITPASSSTFTAKATLKKNSSIFYTLDYNNVSVGF